MKWITFIYFSLFLQDNPVSVIFVGDVSFDSCIMYYVNHGYNCYNDTMAKVAGPIRKADIAVGNLESPYLTKAMLKDNYKGEKGIFVDAHPDSAAALR